VSLPTGFSKVINTMAWLKEEKENPVIVADDRQPQR
jgi:hypothetical protein